MQRMFSMCLALLVLQFAGVVAAAEKSAAPIYDGRGLPTPQEQNAAWSHPATKLPRSLLKDVDLLFAMGVADPRGGDYRQIEVVTGSCWDGDTEIAKTHGWVLPSVAGQRQRFAVCWNGLVYPLVSIGGAADLAADIAPLCLGKPQEKYGVTPEAMAVAFDNRTPLKVCLLLRLGKVDLAERLWPLVEQEWKQRQDPDPDERDADIFLQIACDWCWYAFDRAMCAHMSGNDVVSRDTAKLLTNALPRIDVSAKSLGIKRPPVIDKSGQVIPGPYIQFVEPLPALLADEERRVKEVNVERVLDNPKRFPDKAKRIAALVRDLEVVSARQVSQPGGVWLGIDPVAIALQHEDTDAIEPLLNCLESDQRLTRSVQFSRDFGSDRELLPVRQAAYFVLQQILQTETFGPDTDDYRQLAAQIRTYWSKEKGKSAAERWFDTLADDAAGPKRWIEAAHHIVDPTDFENPKVDKSIPRRKANEVPPMKGEALRAKRHPSVSELMAKRVPSVAADNEGWLFAQSSAADLALDLHQWDAAAAVPVLREQMKRCMHASDDDRQHISPEPNSVQSTQTTELMALDVGQLTTALAESGDAEGTRMYCAWIVRQNPLTADTHVAAALQPIWRFSDEPNLAATAEELFNGPKSAWRCLATAVEFDDRQLMHSPIFGVPAFRKHVARNLNDTAPIGTVWVKDDMYEFETAKERGSESGVNMRDPLLPKPAGKKTRFRVCDWYASKIAALEGAPPFELYWPVANRDAARTKLAAFLDRWGDHFRYSPVQHSLPREFRDVDTPYLTFPRLDHPATNADVAATRAIFALTGGKVRVVPLPAWPAEAKWTALRDFPIQYQGGTDSKTGATTYYDDFLNRGLIWQAEEVEVNGKWERYYGFVGAHEIAKVPASEIEFIERH